MFAQVSKAFGSTMGSIKGAFVTKPFVPNAYQANPSQIVDSLENAFKEMFEIAPCLEPLRGIAPRQAYAGGESVFVYGARRTSAQLEAVYQQLKDIALDAWGTSAIIILSLPATVSDSFVKGMMGFAVPANLLYYSVKHASFDAGKFGADVTAQLHGTKLAMQRYNRTFLVGSQAILHTKQVVLSSGRVLTGVLTSTGTVTLFYSNGNRDEVSVQWESDLRAVKLVKTSASPVSIKNTTWSEDEFNSVFVKLVTAKVPECVEELAQAALGAKPMTRSAVVAEFAEKGKATRQAEKEVKKEASEEGETETAPAAEVQPETPVESAAAEQAVDGAAPVVNEDAAPAVAQDDAAQETLPEVPTNAAAEAIKATFGQGATVVDMGELAGNTSQKKACYDRQAIKVMKAVMAKYKVGLDAAISTEPKRVQYFEEQHVLDVISPRFTYRIQITLSAQQQQIYTLQAPNLQALGEAIGYDFGQNTTEYNVRNGGLMMKLVGDGSKFDPLVFDLK